MSRRHPASAPAGDRSTHGGRKAEPRRKTAARPLACFFGFRHARRLKLGTVEPEG